MCTTTAVCTCSTLCAIDSYEVKDQNNNQYTSNSDATNANSKWYQYESTSSGFIKIKADEDH